MKYLIIILILLLNLINLQAQTFNFYRTSPELIYTNDTFGIVSNAKINNLTNSPIRLRVIKSYNNFPQGWESCICDIVICHPPGVDTAIADYPPGLSSIDVMIYVHSIPGMGYLTVRTEKVSNPSEYINVNFGCAYNPIGIHQTSTIAKDFNLYQNYPNPFNPMTNIKFQIPKSGQVDLKIYDVHGNEIETLINGQLNPGTYEVSFDASQYPSGIYFYKMTYGNIMFSRKMILLK
jgi:hypothetical protein